MQSREKKATLNNMKDTDHLLDVVLVWLVIAIASFDAVLYLMQ